MGLKLKRVEPIGKTPSVHVDLDKYPKSEEATALREERRRLGISLGEAASRLGISLVQMSQLERGQYECDWALANTLLRGGLS